MTKKFWVGLALLFLVPGLLFVTSCAKKAIKSEPGVSMTGEGVGGTGTEAGTGQRAMEEQRLQEERLREEAKTRRELAEKEAFENESIYFEFDKSTLLPEAKEVLTRKARWAAANPNAAFIVEGHCDERGTNEYNMALGDRRANAAKNYLVDLGVRSTRVTTISYGEERPVDRGHNEDAWAKNRRAQFVLE